MEDKQRPQKPEPPPDIDDLIFHGEERPGPSER